MRILWLLPSLGFTSAARQALLLVPEFLRIGYRVELAVLRSGGELTSSFHAAEIPVHELSNPHHVPFHCIGELERLLRSRSIDLIHVWRMPAMRAMATLRLARAHRPRLIVSQLEREGRWNPLDRLLRQKADRVMPDVGQPQSIPLAVRLPNSVAPPLEVAIPENARLIIVLGELTPDHGFRDAVWAFDVLKFVYPDLHLIVIGDGPERDRLVQFSQKLGGQDIRTHFVRGRPDAALWLKRANVVWVPSRKPCGEQVVLEAHSAGVPVVASNLPSLASMIIDQTTGILVKPGDPVGMAMITRPLLDDPNRGPSLANAAQLRLATHQTDVVAGQWLQIYRETCGAPVA